MHRNRGTEATIQDPCLLLLLHHRLSPPRHLVRLPAESSRSGKKAEAHRHNSSLETTRVTATQVAPFESQHLIWYHSGDMRHSSSLSKKVKKERFELLGHVHKTVIPLLWSDRAEQTLFADTEGVFQATISEIMS